MKAELKTVDRPDVLLTLSYDKALHYRMIDVSSFTTAFPGVLDKPESGNHRAESDIDNSISIHRELRGIVKMVEAQSARVPSIKAPTPPPNETLREAGAKK